MWTLCCSRPGPSRALCRRPAATPCRNVAVVAYARDAAGGWTYVDRVSTDARGHYSIGGVGTGKYRLKAVDKWPYPWSGADRGEYLDEWYDGMRTR